MPIDKVYSVNEISLKIQKVIQGLVPGNIKIRGEITNLSLSKAGHLYFDLKDDKANISTALFRNSISYIHSHNNKVKIRLLFSNEPIILEHGMEIIAEGSLNTYIKASRYQMIIDNISLKDDIGALHKRFLKLREKLEKEGYFQKEKKIPIPLYPEKIAIITSATGAAIKDIYDTLNNVPFIDKKLFAVSVQGDKAPRDIIEKLNIINFDYGDQFDLILLARGGGSYEDLFCFNDEELVKKIYASKIPVITAIGHERDFTLSDFVSDKSAITPTAGASHIISGYIMAYESIEKTMKKIKYLMDGKLKSLEEKIKYLSSARIRPLVQTRINNQKQYIETLFYDKADTYISNYVKEQKQKAEYNLHQKILPKINTEVLDKRHLIKNRMDNAYTLLAGKISEYKLILSRNNPRHIRTDLINLINKNRQRISYYINTIENLSPNSLLKKGYSITYDQRGNILNNIADIFENEMIITKLYKGTIKSNIVKINNDKEESKNE